jgi:hypothetical protein
MPSPGGLPCGEASKRAAGAHERRVRLTSGEPSAFARGLAAHTYGVLRAQVCMRLRTLHDDLSHGACGSDAGGIAYALRPIGAT